MFDEDDIKDIKERYAELLIQEMYDNIVEGISEREDNETEWTIFAEIPDQVAIMLKDNGYEVDKDNLKFTVRWG